jgi:hypothetical protein
VREGELETGGHRPAKLAEHGGVEDRIKPGGAEAAEVLRIQGGEEVGGELLEFGQPPCVAGESLAMTDIRGDGKLAGVTPAGGFAHDRAVDLGDAVLESGQVIGGREGAVIKQVFLDTVAEEPTELGPGAQLGVDAGGGVVVADIDAVAAHELVEDDLLIPGRKIHLVAGSEGEARRWAAYQLWWGQSSASAKKCSSM